MMPFDIKHIEAVMKLMSKHAIDEYSSEHFTLKKTKFLVPKRRVRAPRAAQVEASFESDQEFLDEHTADPVSDAPWDQIPEEALDRFSINGRLGD